MDHEVDKELSGWPQSQSCGYSLMTKWRQVALLRGQNWDQHYLTSPVAAWTMGQNIPPPVLPMTSGCVMQTTLCREAVTSRGTLKDLRSDLMQTS